MKVSTIMLVMLLQACGASSSDPDGGHDDAGDDAGGDAASEGGGSCGDHLCRSLEGETCESCDVDCGSCSTHAIYVSNSGNPTCSDDTSYANNSASQPWCTIGRAAWGSNDPNAPNPAEAAQPGDLVLIAAGRYATTCPRAACGSGARFEVCLNPANSGTQGNPITFRGVGIVRIESAAGSYGPVIGASQRDYIHWDHFVIDDSTVNNCADTGSIVLNDSDHCRIERVELHGAYRAWSDNYNGIRLNGANDNLVRDNTITGIDGNWGQNCSAIMTYSSSRNLFERNTIRSSLGGIFLKGASAGTQQQDNIIRHNLLEGMTNNAINIAVAERTHVFQNVLRNNYYGVKIYPNIAGTGGSSGLVLANNTIVGSEVAGVYVKNDAPAVSNMRVWNNLIVGSSGHAIDMGETAIGDFHFEHNLYFTFGAFGSLDGAEISFASWQSNHGQESSAPAGLVADPRFVDGPNGNYHLGTNASARTLGIDILDLDDDNSITNLVPAGAYVTDTEVIGSVQ